MSNELNKLDFKNSQNKLISNVTAEEIKAINENAKHYVDGSKKYKK